MEVIEELETVPRGLYTGAIGYLGFNGESQFNIAIRTLERRGSRLSFGVGAGILADSAPEMEFQESYLNKWLLYHPFLLQVFLVHLIRHKGLLM